MNQPTKPCFMLLVALIAVALVPCECVHAQSYDKVSPFSEVRWTDSNVPEVKIADQWYAVQAIDGVAINDIVDFCKKTWGARDVQRRFEEDLVEVLSKMEHPPEKTVTLKVVNLETKAEETLSDIEMTLENRQALWEARATGNEVQETLDELDKNKDGMIQLDEVPESHLSEFKKIDANKDDVATKTELAVWLLSRNGGGERKSTVTVKEAIADLDDFQRQLEERFAYLHANHIDYRTALDAIRKQLATGGDKPVEVSNLEAEIGKVISMFIDGHAGPRGFNVKDRAGRRLPFILETAGDRFVAVNFDRKSLVDADHPYVVSLDGIGLERWLAAMDPFVNVGSPQLVRRQMARYLRFVEYARQQMGLPSNDELTIGLASGDGTNRVEHKIKLVTESPETADLVERKSGVLDGNIGYLRLASFSGGSPSAVELIQQWMPKFRETNGLVVDVRNNGGGSREALLELFPYLLKPGEVHIGNVCAYRLYKEFDDDHLAARYAYRETEKRWDENEVAAIKRFKASFHPEWSISKEGFSAWHYLVLSKRADDDRYHYDKPVVLLTNSYCFSATDIFVGAFKGFRNVTIMGQSTGGGSARTKRESLPNSGIEIRLASMASFQPNGLLYDGRGVAADIRVDPSPQSFLIDGEDSLLKAAKRLLLK